MRRPLPLWLVLPCLLASAAGADRFQITWERRQLTDLFYAEGATIADLDADGHPDVVAGPFIWRGPQFTERKEFYPAKPFNINGYSDNFFPYARDLDADGRLDLLVIGFPGKEVRWYRNPGEGSAPWPMHLALPQLDNESAGYGDLTGDGEPELFGSVNGVFGFASPRKEDPAASWTWHRISPEKATGGKFTHGLGIGDVNGDGRLDLLEKSRWWEQPASLEGDPEWQAHRADFTGPGGAQMFAWDFDGDGAQDVLSSLAAHSYGLAWFRQEQGKFSRRLITTEEPLQNPYGVAFSQIHGIALEDIDGDGLKDIITGKRYWAHNGHDPGERDPAVIYWFQTVREPGGGVTFVPHLIDDQSGVGVEVKVADANSDGLPDVVVANKHGVFLHLQKRAKVDEATWLASQPRRAFLEGIKPMETYASGRPAPGAAAAMTVPPGFQVQLIASEPHITQPVTFCFDERGRLWVAEALNYPIPAAPGGGKDRIHIFEDADHNGSFESHKIFAENLNLVSGLEVGFGGVWVGAAPYLLFLPDRNADDVPDGEPEILLDGWGTQDTHETLNAFRWGQDGWLYGCHGVFTKSQVGKPGTPDQDRVFLDAGVWRYHPVQHRFEVFARGTSNPWGLDYDRFGEWFATACVIPHLWHIVPGAYYERQAGQHQNPALYDLIGTIAKHRHYAGSVADSAHWGPRRDAKSDVVGASTFQAGGGHAHCGLSIYQGDNFPPDYRDALLMHNLHGHRMNWDHVSPAGASYTGDRRPDFLFANDHWYVGTQIGYGPDGALYFADWHDDTTCHRRDDAEWDRSNGRIFRVHHGELKPARVSLGTCSDPELAALHTHRNQWFVRTARRLLQERAASRPLDPSALRTLQGFLGPEHPDPLRLDALGTLHACGLGPASPVTGERLIARAVRYQSEAGTLDPLDSESALVRREVASALRLLPGDRGRAVATSLVASLPAEEDPLVERIAWYGLEPLVARDPAWALGLAGTTRHAGTRERIYRRIAALPDHRALLFAEPATRVLPVLTALAAQLKAEAPQDAPPAWTAFYDRARPVVEKNGEARRQLLFLAGKFRDARVRPEMRSLLADSTQSDDLRLVALEFLASDPESLPTIRALVGSESVPLRQGAVTALAKQTDPESINALVSALPKLSPGEQSAALSLLCASPGPAKQVLNAVAAGRLARNVVSVVAARQLQRLDDPEVNRLLADHWGTLQATGGDFAARLAKWKGTLTPERLAKANPANGRLLFTQSCQACHVLYGQGNLLGPDLTGGNRGDLDYLLENLLNPNAVIGKEYQLQVLHLKDQSIVSGLVGTENASALTLQLPGGVVQTVPKDAIVRRESLSQSLMPEGLLEAFSEVEAIDLIAYLRSDRQVPVARPGERVVEGESLQPMEVSGGRISRQAMSGFKADRWSGDAQLWWTGGKPGDRLTLPLEISEAGTYAISAVFTKAPDYGQVRIWLDQTHELIRSLDLYAPGVRTTGVVELGSHTLPAGVHKFQIDLLDKNPQALPRFMAGLDAILLLRK